MQHPALRNRTTDDDEFSAPLARCSQLRQPTGVTKETSTLNMNSVTRRPTDFPITYRQAMRSYEIVSN